MTTIVLAAGLSSRMGDNKLMLLYQDKPIIRVTVEKAISASDRVIVVLGHDKERVEDAISGLDAGTVFNPVYTSGMKSIFGSASSTARSKNAKRSPSSPPIP